MRYALIALAAACDHAAPPPPVVASHPARAIAPPVAVSHDPGIDDADSYGWTALHHAAEDGKIAEIERLVAHGASLEARTSQHETPLLVALDHDQHDAALWLLAHGASVAGDLGRTALILAARDGQDELVERLLGSGVPLAGSIALELAAKYDHVSTIELLVRLGADANFTDADDHGFTPLIVAAQENHPKAVEALLDAGASAEQRDADGTTALHWAVYGARPDEIHMYESLDKPHDTIFRPQTSAPVVKLLLARGAKVDTADPEGNTALIEAVFMDSEVAAKELLAAGADRRHKNHEGKTAYDLAHARKSSFEALLHP